MILFSLYRTTTLRGMTIPKGAQVIPLLHAVHMNPELWEDPERFNPERFLSKDGTSVIKPDCFIPFGVGRRSCIGDTLVMSQLLLFFSSLLHSFDIRLPEGVTDAPELNGICGATFAPKSFQVNKHRYFSKQNETVYKKVFIKKNLHEPFRFV